MTATLTRLQTGCTTITDPAALRALLGQPSERSQLWDPSRNLAAGEMPALAQMIMDQIRPPGRSDEEHARIVADVREQHIKSYCTLY